VLFADFGFGVVVGACIAERNLQVGVLDFSVGNNLKVLKNLYIALVGVEDYVEVLVRSEHLGKDVAERFFENANHCGLVDVLEFFELCELFDHVRGFLFLFHAGLLCCFFYCSVYFLACGASHFRI